MRKCSVLSQDIRVIHFSLLTFFALFSVLVAITAFASGRRPVADFETVDKILIGTTSRYDLTATHQALVSQMPKGVEIFIYSDVPETLSETRRKLQTTPQFDRVHFVLTESQLGAPGLDLWARDFLPYPIVTSNSPHKLNGLKFSYFDQVDPTASLRSILNFSIVRDTSEFEGGNLVADRKGNCFSVELPDLEEFGLVPVEALTKLAGCKETFVLPYYGGIGHADERLLFLSDSLAATDRLEIRDILQGLGYRVLLLPFLEGSDFSYLNSVVVNDTLFVPSFDLESDQMAIKILAQSGLRIVPVPSRTLTEEGSGSIHCLTRTYPSLGSK